MTEKEIIWHDIRCLRVATKIMCFGRRKEDVFKMLGYLKNPLAWKKVCDTIELRYNDGSHYTKDEHGRFTGSTSSGGKSSAMFHDSNFDKKEITDETIANVPLVNVFDDETKNEAYQKANSELLAEAKKYFVGTEVSIVYDENMKPIENYGYVVGEIGGGKVNIADPNVPYHAFHNHPTDSTLSVDDLINLTKHDNMLSITAVGNGGKVYCMQKKDISKSLAYRMFLQQQAKQKIFLGEHSYFDIKNGKLRKDDLSEDDAKIVIQQLSAFSDKCVKAGAFCGFDYRQK